ncbi:uncharacterized protein [Penaeus vannamei]|uniref:uncharacterized protein n=1 Tax=Penaeus vannamei TaxID=6689 RepID=UPI00387F8286
MDIKLAEARTLELYLLDPVVQEQLPDVIPQDPILQRRTAYALFHPRSAGHATRRRLHSPVHLLHPKRWFLPPPWQSVQGRSLSGRMCEWRRPWIFEEENNMYRMMYTVELVLFAVSLSLYQNKDQKIGLAMTCNKHGGIK